MYQIGPILALLSKSVWYRHMGSCERLKFDESFSAANALFPVIFP